MSYADVNGISVYYEEHGSGRPLILLPGGLGAASMYAPILPMLAKDPRSVARLAILPGHTHYDIFGSPDLVNTVVRVPVGAAVTTSCPSRCMRGPYGFVGFLGFSGFLGPARRCADILSANTSTATNTQMAATPMITLSSMVITPSIRTAGRPGSPCPGG